MVRATPPRSSRSVLAAAGNPVVGCRVRLLDPHRSAPAPAPSRAPAAAGPRPPRSWRRDPDHDARRLPALGAIDHQEARMTRGIGHGLRHEVAELLRAVAHADRDQHDAAVHGIRLTERVERHDGVGDRDARRVVRGRTVVGSAGIEAARIPLIGPAPRSVSGTFPVDVPEQSMAEAIEGAITAATARTRARAFMAPSSLSSRRSILSASRRTC